MAQTAVMPDTLTDDQMAAMLAKQNSNLKPAVKDMPDTLTDDQMSALMRQDAPGSKITGKDDTSSVAGQKSAKTGKRRFAEEIAEAADRTGLNLDLAHKLVKQESGYNPKATSPKGAMGLTQLMPGTAKMMGVKNPYDPQENLNAGFAHFAGLMSTYKNDPAAAAAAYNMGQQGYEDYLQGKRKLPGETQKYVKAVAGVDLPERITSSGQKIARAIAPYARPALEYGGAMGGALAGGVAGGASGSIVPFAGTAAGAMAGSVAGSGLGYAAGRQAANALDEYAGIKEPEADDLKAFTQVGMDVLHGALMEAGGQVAGKFFLEPVAKWAGGKLSDAGKGLYRSTMKPSTTATAEKIDKVVATGLEGKYWITDKGLQKLKSDRLDMAQKLGKVVDKMSARGNRVNIDDVAAEVEKLKDSYKGIDQTEAHAAIDERIEALYARVNQSGRITAKEAHEIKQGIYKDLGEKAYGEMKAAAKEADKQIARQINDQLKSVYPEYGKINQELSNKINLQKYLERAVNRVRNHNRVSLTDMITIGSALSGGTIHGGPQEGAALAVATYITKKTLDSPAVKSRLAYALMKSAKMTGENLGRPFSYATDKITNWKENAPDPALP